ncbi:MAG: leucyl/phenylalanyl-tRNA--protein transferase [Halioglobus sp.]|jgi:leucyl/phenylalanyl-tRNA--protein transferase
MQKIWSLDNGSIFPPTSEALDEPNGLLAMGGELSSQRLLAAYRRGIFPWYSEPQPVLWWTPDPRSVLFPEELHISRSLQKTLRADALHLAIDTRFTQVIDACAELRDDGLGTWIDDDMTDAYSLLHSQGYAHSIEVLDADGGLLGGLYGLALGKVFFGESMFSRRSNCSKVALVALVHLLRQHDFRMIDCQVESEHMNSLGARNISRLDFEQRLAQTVDVEIDPNIWCLPSTCGELL